MVRITIDQAFCSKLGNSEEPLELCDETGRVVGHFIPVQDRAVYQGVESPAGDDELDRRCRDEAGRPLVDILRDLEQQQ
ncbi:MAG: hypothetical protein J5I93_26965 [Pirellulaceae bacterium]|nr:hypothetical protein [Pirellulaceae bacterium]